MYNRPPTQLYGINGIEAFSNANRLNYAKEQADMDREARSAQNLWNIAALLGSSAAGSKWFDKWLKKHWGDNAPVTASSGPEAQLGSMWGNYKSGEDIFGEF